MDRLTAVRVFVEVADRLSLTQTAEHLDMSVAMVSRYLIAVETWFGAKLLHRTTRKVSLTDAGSAALPSCRQLLELSEDAQYLAAQSTREPSGVLRVTTSGAFAEAQLTAALVEFQEQHQQIEIVLSLGAKQSDLVADRIDLAVRITNHLDPLMIARRLTDCRSVLCASPNYLLRHEIPQTPEELHLHHHITHSFGARSQYQLTCNSEKIVVPVNSRFHTNETISLRRAVLSGAGIGMLPTYCLGDDLRSGRLIRLLPDYEPEIFGIHAIYRSRQYQPLALRLLVDFLAARFAGNTAPWDRN